MAGYRKKSGPAPLAVTILLIAAIAAAVLIAPHFMKDSAPEEEYPWIEADGAAVGGSLSGVTYSGARNDASKLSYSIAEEIRVKDGAATLKIENPGKNTLLMTVTVTVGGEQVYQTGYLKPGQYILTDALDAPLDPGTYAGTAVFEGFDPETEESRGTISVDVGLSVR
ncbi:MAG: hypothetical protein KBC20_04045 [Oscillospiraceae bacterium]|nr:hypothetical protein [Oscillospiraceae bacterium]